MDQGFDVILKDGKDSSFRIWLSPDQFIDGDALNAHTSMLLTGCWLSLLCDSPLHNDDAKAWRPAYQYNRFADACRADIRSLIRRLSELGDALLADQHSVDWLEAIGTIPLHDRFKETPVFKEFLYFDRSDDSDMFQWLISFLYLGKKVEFLDPRFSETALRGWEKVEAKLSSFTSAIESDDGYTAEVVEDLATAIRWLLPDPHAVEFLPHHGPGAVNGPERGEVNKTLSLYHTPKLDLLLRRGSTCSILEQALESTASLDFVRDSLYGSDAHWCAYDSGEYIDPNHRPTGQDDLYSGTSSEHELKSYGDTSVLMFVPKNYKTARSICMEPTPVMFFQQGIRAMLEASIMESSLGSFIHLRDQSHNQEGALWGSLTGLVDTIDLSAASDSVHFSLIKRIFPPKWRYLLQTTRTAWVLKPDGVRVRVNKFAPMGSALCFPTQCIVYTAVVLVAYLRTFALDRARPITNEDLDKILGVIPTHFEGEDIQCIGVYGDDIICDCRATDEVISILSSLGFDVNETKSYYGGHKFRESCGIYALNGHDVTPLVPRLRHCDSAEDWSPEFLASWVALANRSLEMGFLNLRRFVINVGLRWGVTSRCPRGLLFASQDVTFNYGGRKLSYAFITEKPVNSHLEPRINADYQRVEVRHRVLRPRKRVSAETRLVDPVTGQRIKSGMGPIQLSAWDYYSLHMDVRAKNLRGELDDDDFVDPRVLTIGLDVGWGWTPTGG